MPELRDEVTRRDIVLHHANQIRDHLAHLPSSREKALVLTKLEEAELWLTRVTADEADQPAFGPSNNGFVTKVADPAKPRHGVSHPADGSLSPAISNDIEPPLSDAMERV